METIKPADSNSRIFTIIPKPHTRIEGFIRCSCQYTIVENNSISLREELFFDIPDSEVPPNETDCNGYLIALLMEAMSLADAVHIKGSVCPVLLSNLTEFQEAWHCWFPDLLNIVSVSADTIDDFESKSTGAIAAFSGGIDAAFTVRRHLEKQAGHASENIRICAFIHGFDIPLEETEFYDLAFQKNQEVLNEVGLPLLPIRTNFRKVSKTPWAYSHTPAFVGAFYQLKNRAGKLLFGSSEPYNALVLPWGSNPITDPLLSSASFVVTHDGAAYSRTQKTIEVSKWTKAHNELRVCWQERGDQLNCCRCEKCLRTTLNFLSTNNTIPSSLVDRTPLTTRINQLYLKGEIPMNEWRTAINFAKRSNRDADWLVAASRKLKEARRRAFFKQLRKHLRHTLFRKDTSSRETRMFLKAKR